MSIKKHKAQTPKEINAANKEFWDGGYKALDSNGLPNFKGMTHSNLRSMMGMNQFVDEAINELGQLAQNPLIAEGDLAQEKLSSLHITLTTLLEGDSNNLPAFVDAMKMLGWLYCKAGIDLGAIKNQGRAEANSKRKSDNSKGGKSKNKPLKAYAESIISNYSGKNISAVLNNIYMEVQGYAKDNGLRPLSDNIKKKKNGFTYGMETLKTWIKSCPNNQIKFDQ